jgi:hypothetical protein
MDIKARLRVRLIALVAAVCAIVTVGLIAPQEALAADQNGCSVTIDNPHASSGAAGVIAKGRFQCSHVPSTIYINGSRSTSFLLWLCPRQPPKDEGYLTLPYNGCSVKGSDGSNVAATVANTVYTRYVPPGGTQGAHGNGWWIACAVWYSHGPLGTPVGNITTFSNPVQINA